MRLISRISICILLSVLLPGLANAQTTWNQVWGGENREIGRRVQQTTEGGYIVVGFTSTYAADEGDIWLIKTDANGVFSYAAPCAGWWGFAALSDADFKLEKNGEDKDVELGAVIWVKFHEMKFN